MALIRPRELLTTSKRVLYCEFGPYPPKRRERHQFVQQRTWNLSVIYKLMTDNLMFIDLFSCDFGQSIPQFIVFLESS